MRVLKPILRNLLLSPTRVVAIDDQRSWRGIDVYIAALHLAKAIKAASVRDRGGIMRPPSGLFPVAMIATGMLGRPAVPLNYLLKKEDLPYVIDDGNLDVLVTATPMLLHFGELPDK